MTSAFDAALVRLLRSRLDEAIKDREDVINNGKMGTWEQYKYALGQRNGLQQAFDMLNKADAELSNPDPKVRRVG
jgi:hypothetical protein